LGNETHNTTASGNSTAGLDDNFGALTGGGRAPEEFYESFKSGGSGYGSGSVMFPTKLAVLLRSTRLAYVGVALADPAATARPVTFSLLGKKCDGEHQLGPRCVDPAPLLSGSSVNKTVTPFDPAYLVFTVPPNVGNITVTARDLSGAEPVQVLLLRGNAPTYHVFDAKSKQIGEDYVADLSLPAESSNWYAEVSVNTSIADVTLSAVYESCAQGLTGSDCSAAVVELSTNPGTLVQGVLSPSGVHYYKIKPNNGSSIAVNVQNMAGGANPLVYVRLGVAPELGNIKYYDIVGCTEVATRCQAVAVRASAGFEVGNNTDWFIAVVGSEENQKYGIWNALNDACPDNCNGNGDCTGSIGGGVCACHEDFVGLIDCSQSTPSTGGLETWEWVLIVIGIIIAAVIIIGLAVYFVRRAQSRAGFERV
jgi:hypothetical protein